MLERMDNPLPPSAAPAHLGWRLLAMTYDLFVLLAIWFVTSGLELLAVGGRTSDELGAWAKWLLLALLWLATGAYFVVSWRRGGHTVGMRAWRLKVLSEDGRVASWPALAARYAMAGLSLFAGGLGFVWTLIDSEHRAWHDIVSHTRLVRMDRA